MFDFLFADPYANRAVKRTEVSDDFIIDTARVNDGTHPIETAVMHPEYNGGKCVIVEAYDTETEALAGHDKWVSIMTQSELPGALTDCANSEISQMVGIFGGPMVFSRTKREEE